MFDKIRDNTQKAFKWQKIQGEVKKQQEQVFVTQEKRGVKVVVRGDKKVERVEIDGEEQKEIKELLNDAFKEVDKKLEKKLRGQASELGLGDL